MAGRRIPPVPRGMGARGRAFWRDVHATWELNRDELEILVEVCRTLDQVDALRATLAEDGFMVPGSQGQPRVHPAVREINASRALLGKLLAQLGLPGPEDEQMPTMTSVRARRAAEVRWMNTPRKGGPRGA